MELRDILDSDGNKTGKIGERGKPLNKGEYYLIIDTWIINSKGEFLISKRSPNKYPEPDKWEPTCGCAVAGDDSISAALREVKEELGIILNPQNGKLIKRFKIWNHAIIDVWLFRQEIDIDCIILQEEETDDVMWATKDLLEQLIENGDFLSNERIPYMEELFKICGL